MKQDTTVCIITYNSAKYLSNLLKGIQESSFKDFAILFIDNGSTDETVAHLKNCKIEHNLINLPKNIGHSYAVNVALDACNTKYLILLDHDTIVDENLFKNLYAEAKKYEDTDFAVYAPKVVDKSRNQVYYGGYFHYIGKMCESSLEPEKPELEMAGSTALLFDLFKVPKDLRFDEDFFIYCNDTDFLFRLRAMGKKIRYVPSAVVTHLEGTHGFSHRGGVEYSPTRAFYAIRNQRLLVFKDYGLTTALSFLPCFLLYEMATIVFCLKKRVFIKGYIYSILSTIKLLPKIIRKRAAFQKDRTVGDKDLVRWCKLDYMPGVINTKFEEQCKSFFDQFLKFYFFMIKNSLWS